MVIRSGLYEEMTLRSSPKDQTAASPAKSKKEEHHAKAGQGDKLRRWK